MTTTSDRRPSSNAAVGCSTRWSSSPTARNGATGSTDPASPPVSPTGHATTRLSRLVLPAPRYRTGSTLRRRMTMASKTVWTYRGDIDTTAKNLVAYDVEAADGGIGKIDKASTEVNRQYLVVDTGFWIFGKKRLIP